MSWQARALCRTTPTDVFYPTGHRDSAEYQAAMARARAFCARCPVRQECWKTALRNEERWGVWAGVDFTTDWRRDGRRRVVAA